MNVKWKIRPAPGGGYDGIIEIPVHPSAVAGGGKITAVASGSDKATALAKASVVADQIMANPVVAALMPPQAALAVKAIKTLSKSAAVGKMAEVASKFTGPAMDRLKKVLPW